MSFEDIIHNKSFDFINSLNKTISATKVSSPALQDVSLQIIIHLVSCISALRDTLETNNNKPKTAMQTQIVSPLLNGLMATVGKVIMDNFAFEPKFAEQESFATAYCSLMRHAFRLFPDMAVKRHKASGKLLLHHAAFRAKAYIVDDSIQNILAVSPDSASVTDNSGALALHWATRNPEITASGIDLLISGYPKGVEHADEKGFMPCHWAVNQDTPNMDVLRRLLKVFPVAVRTPSRTGNLPLHYAVMRDRPNVTAVKALLAVFPDAISVRCLEGYLPIHRLVHRATVDKETLSLLIKHYPDGLTQVTEQGQTPLLVALDFPKPDYAAVAILLRACKDACLRPDLGDYYPLHMALDCAKPDYKIALEILRAYPEAAKKETKEGLTPLHLMVSTNVAMTVSLDNDSVDKDFLEALITAYPEALVTVVKDIVPMVGDGVSVAVELLESWSGEWVEQSWDVIGKARARGLELLALVLEEQLRSHFPNHTLLNKHNNNNNNNNNDSNKLVSSQPLKTLTSEALSPLAKPILPPRKFTLDPETNNNNNDDNSPHKELTPTNLKLNNNSINNHLNKTDDDTIQPFSLPPEVDEDTSIQHVSTKKTRSETQPSQQQTLQDLDEDELPQEPQLPLSQHQADAISETAVTVISSLSGTQKSKTGRPGRAPPAGPIPSSLLQAAENSSAMRMSKSQYEMLLGRAANNNSVAGDSQSENTRRSKVSKKELLLARQQRQSNNNNNNNNRQPPPVSHSHLQSGYYSSDGGESDYKYDSGSERDSETPAIQMNNPAVTTNPSLNNNNNNNNNSSVTPVNVVQPRHRGPPPTAQQRNNLNNNNNNNSNSNNNNNNSDADRAVLSKTAPTPFVSPLIPNTSNNNHSNVPSSSTLSGKVRIFPQDNGSDMV